MRNKSKLDLLNLLPANRTLRHLLFWVLVYLADVIFFGIGYENVGNFAIYALLEMPGQILFAYVAIYWIMPRYLDNNNVVSALLVSALAFFASGLITQITFHLFNQVTPEEQFWDMPKLMMRAFYCFLKACIAILAKLGMLWLENQKKLAALEKTKLSSELKMLKDQVNPHFMFNTLNNLFGLVGKDPALAQDAILRLSGILQFMLHESNQPSIPLGLEIKCIRDYIELEKLRYAGILSVSLNVDETVSNLSIVPLMLFPFVENSFKHGSSESVRDAWINIDISSHKGNFIFKIANAKPLITTNGKKGGIGLQNVKRRLELIYGTDHQLEIINDNNSFLVVLRIALMRMTSKSTLLYEEEMSDR